MLKVYLAGEIHTNWCEEIINNKIVMHSRGEYEDYTDLDSRRHLLRLWMAITPEMTTKTLLTPADL